MKMGVTLFYNAIGRPNFAANCKLRRRKHRSVWGILYGEKSTLFFSQGTINAHNYI